MSHISAIDTLIPAPENAVSFEIRTSTEVLVLNSEGYSKVSNLMAYLYKIDGNSESICSDYDAILIIYNLQGEQIYHAHTDNSGIIEATISGFQNISRVEISWINGNAVVRQRTIYSTNDGAVGLSGISRRITDWSDGTLYRNDTNVSSSLRYIDFVTIVSESGTIEDASGNKFNLYEAKPNHNGVLSSLNNKPEFGESWENYWSKITDQQPVFTSLILANLIKASQIDVDSVIANGIKGKTIDVEDATFKNVKMTNASVTGTSRNPFVNVSDGYFTDFNDNVVLFSNGKGGWINGYNLPWDKTQTGRRMTLINYKWGETISTGVSGFTAPSGKYFYEDGMAKSSLGVSRELVELIGYGDSTSLYGWIVLRRIDLMTTRKYGRSIKSLAHGIVVGNVTGTSFQYFRTFDGLSISNPGEFTVTRTGEGVYRINFPSSWGLEAGKYLVNLTGYGMARDYADFPIKATVASVASNYFVVNTSDDNSRNDGSFMFQIINMDDFNYEI